jgi:hypothetical protein
MADTNRTTVRLDWSKMLGFDQATTENAESAPYAAKIGVKQMVRRPGEVDSVAMARRTNFVTKRTLDGSPIAALSAKVGTKTVVALVATATGFDAALEDGPAVGPSPSAATLIFPTAKIPANLSVDLDWTKMLGFDQAATENAGSAPLCGENRR